MIMMEIIALLKWGKTRHLLKKIRDTKGTFHVKMGTIKQHKWYGPNRSRY